MHFWLLTLTFISVNLDFFFMLLFLLKKYRVQQVMLGYLLGTLILLTLSFTVGKVLAAFLPEWLLGVLGILPIYMALRADDDDDDAAKGHGGPIVTVLVTYLSVCAGCNLSIFLPVLAGESLAHFGLTLIFIGVLTVLVVLILKLIADIPVVTQVMDRYGTPLMKVCYILIGIYVFWDSGLLTHLLSWV
ncbi:cadmium resistance transporter [Lacticaseibacillus baoqingensis]|uniref:Cadmium resistance transporter n=1 Tax=Lacticaseibacillus baoqingensis TaxID=2486013 RepID=A0ABW4E4V5_9LACO|nr:cadmium resistance transporter [Lacticaseibacillus baoqingensis]